MSAVFHRIRSADYGGVMREGNDSVTISAIRQFFSITNSVHVAFASLNKGICPKDKGDQISSTTHPVIVPYGEWEKTLAFRRRR
jgi:hypothetical protein